MTISGDTGFREVRCPRCPNANLTPKDVQAICSAKFFYQAAWTSNRNAFKNVSLPTACGINCRSRFIEMVRQSRNTGYRSKAATLMPYIMVDIESDGPIPGDYSMICFGAVIVEPELNRTFYGKLKPISDAYVPDALAVSGFSRGDCLAFDDPKSVMEQFHQWLKSHCKGRMLFVSDNNGFDWQFINWYFHHFIGTNPFGFSSMNLGSLYKGMQNDTFVNFKHLRKTKHTHHPVDDARGNAEALLQMKEMGLKISFH